MCIKTRDVKGTRFFGTGQVAFRQQNYVFAERDWDFRDGTGTAKYCLCGTGQGRILKK